MHVYSTSYPHGASTGSSLRGAQLPVWNTPGSRFYSQQLCQCLPRQVLTSASTAWQSAALSIEQVWHHYHCSVAWHLSALSYPALCCWELFTQCSEHHVLLQASTPPSSWYTTAEVLEREVTRVFTQHWVCVGHLGSLDSLGSFQSGTYLDMPWVVTRADDGQLRAFHNVSIHANLCDQASQISDLDPSCPA